MNERVLVLDGEQRAALAVTRSLLRAGCSVYVHARHAWALAAKSRGACHVPRHADPLATPDRFVDELASLVDRLGLTVLLPVTDASATAVLGARASLPASLCIPFAPFATYLAASDKTRVHEAARGTGLEVVQTHIVRDPDDVPSAPDFYPGVVKPHRSVIVADAQGFRTSVQFVEDAEECAAVLRRLPPAAFPALVQRRVVGAGVGVFVGRWQGHTFARFAHRRLREMPPGGGVSTYSESIALPDALRVATDTLLDRLEWDGVAMVECKEDRVDGGWKVMEVNGRFWGSLQLAIDAGVDFPALLLREALGREGRTPPDWVVGRRLRWEWGDVDHVLVRMIRTRARLRLPEHAPGRVRALASFLGHVPGRDRLEVFRWRDPMPFVAECLARLRLVR